MTQITGRPPSTALTDSRLGLPQSTALVMGSIIGVGIFSLPYAIASYGPISLAAMGPGAGRRTRRDLGDEGIQILPVVGSELGRGRGGPRCMTCPIEREAVA